MLPGAVIAALLGARSTRTLARRGCDMHRCVCLLLLIMACGSLAQSPPPPLVCPEYPNAYECAAARECETKGGRWGGTESGRGRRPGCNLPTVDAGKPCGDPSECRSACVQDSVTNKCGCYPWMKLPPGQDIVMCTLKGRQTFLFD